jgi:Type VI secretion system/phage-baseplate injector OB domain
VLKHSRVSGTLDTSRLGAALRGPGMDTRTWISYAVIDAVTVDNAEGVFCNVTCLPSNQQYTARLGHIYSGAGFGMYCPVEVDDEVIVSAPSGDPDQGLVVTQRLHSASDPPPEELGANPIDVLLVAKEGRTVRILLSGGGLCEIRSREGAARALAFKDELEAVDNKYAGHIHLDSVGGPTGGPIETVLPNPAFPGDPMPFIEGLPLGSVSIVGTTVLKAE